MENLFLENIPILYFIAVLYILFMSGLKINQRILLVYIFSYIIKVYSVLDCKVMIIILNIALFIYIEYLSNDKTKREILSNFIYKIVDYLYKMIFEYSFLIFLLSLFTKTVFFEYCYATVANMLPFDIMKFYVWVSNIISAFLLIVSITYLSLEVYVTNSFTQMLEKLMKITTWQSLRIDDEDKFKFKLLSRIEDKRYFARKNSYSFLVLSL